MIAVRGRAIEKEDFSILDATATVFRLLDLDVPPGLDSQSVL